MTRNLSLWKNGRPSACESSITPSIRDAEGKTDSLLAARQPQAHRREHAGERIGVGKSREQKREEEQHADRGVG